MGHPRTAQDLPYCLPWLIARFTVPAAGFLYVPADAAPKVARETGA